MTTTTLPMPPNGAVYVDNSPSGGGYIRQQTYSGNGRGSPSACGNAWVSGTYSSDLTIAADNDMIVEGDVARTGDGVLLGLIANNFVRVYHPVSFGSGTGNPACTSTGSAGGRRIDAAILALQHSFIYDNWYCGAPTGDITVYGAIAQKFRGPVGTGTGSTITTGFRKDYVYNDRLRYRYGLDDHHRLPQGLRLQRPPALPRAALLPRSRAGLLADLARDRAGARSQALISSRATQSGALTGPPWP